MTGEGRAASVSSLGSEAPHEDVHILDLQCTAERMRRELHLKDRSVHGVHYRNTFTGEQAVAWLVAVGGAASPEEAVELCQRLLRAGYIRQAATGQGASQAGTQSNPSSRDTFVASGQELYWFVFLEGELLCYPSTQDGGAGDAAGGGKGTSSRALAKLSSGMLGAAMYKDLAKFGKALAQPFKELAPGEMARLSERLSGRVQHEVRDGHRSDPEYPSSRTPTNSMRGPLPPARGTDPRTGGGGGGGNSRHTSVGGGGGGSDLPHLMHSTSRARALLRSSPQQAAGVGGGGAEAPSPTLHALVGHFNETHAHVKEYLQLMRLDLQQHTALQEHITNHLLIMGHQARRVQLLLALQVLLLCAMMASSAIHPALAAAIAAVAAASWWLVEGSGSLAGVAQQLRLGGREGAPSEELGGANRRDSERLLEENSMTVKPTPSVAAGMHERASESDGEFEEPDEAEEELVPFLADFDDWPDSPLLLRPGSSAPTQRFDGMLGPNVRLRLNSGPIPFETDVFKGAVQVFVRHLPTTPSHIFKGKKRLSWFVLQGKFKVPLALDAVVAGHEFHRSFRNLPAPWFIDNMLLPLARKISPSLRVGGLNAPYLLAPLVTASQIVNVSREGSAPPMMEAKEDMVLFNPTLEKGGVPFNVLQRRKYFQADKHRRGVHYTTEHVWTFHLWQEFLDYASNVLSLSYSNYDLIQHLDGQPLQFMVKDMSTGEYVVNLQAWHRAMVAAMGSPPQSALLRSRRSTRTAGETPPTSTTAQPASPGYPSKDGGGAAPTAAAAAGPAHAAQPSGVSATSNISTSSSAQLAGGGGSGTGASFVPSGSAPPIKMQHSGAAAAAAAAAAAMAAADADAAVGWGGGSAHRLSHTSIQAGHGGGAQEDVPASLAASVAGAAAAAGGATAPAAAANPSSPRSSGRGGGRGGVLTSPGGGAS